ncbi:MAG: hypothetical protein D6685_06205 [Bacteroidetes bacterium]|nr:MAG: hypothetical protein D6685_06205 [Bacteroidota bacterium]
MLALALLLGAERPAHAQDFDHEEIIERTFAVEAGQTLRLKSDLGSVRVTGSRKDAVVVRIIKGANKVSRDRAEDEFDAFRVDFRQTPGGVEVEGMYDRPRRWGTRLQVRFEIEVPAQYHVDLETAGGRIAVTDVRGDAHLRTSGGALRMVNIAGDVVARTSGGSIEGEGLGGRVDLRTSGGSIHLVDAGGDVDVRTSGGRITIEDVQGDVVARTSGGSIRLHDIYGTVEAETSGGSIAADLAVQPDGPVRLKTSGGSISLAVRDDVRADVDAKASGGRVRSDLPVTIRGTVGKSHLQGTINGGGPRMLLRSSGGGITLRRR